MFDDAIYGILDELGPKPPASPMPDLLRGKQQGPQQPAMMQPPPMQPQAYPPNPVPQTPLNPPQQQAMAQPQAQPRPIPQATPLQQPAPPQGYALPQATAAAAGGDWNTRIRDVQSRLEAAQADEQAALQPIDRSAMERMYKERAATGGGHLVRALAAIEAGKEFAPISQHYLKASEEAEAPMKMAGGTMTAQGFIEDPGYAQDLKLKRAQARVQSIEKALEFNLTAQQREDLQREKLRAEAALKQQHDETLRAIASNRPSNEPLVQVIGPDGNAMYVRRSEAVGMQPPAKGGGKGEGGTEGERAAAGYLGRMQAVEGKLDTLVETGKPSLLTKTLGANKYGRLVRPYLESTPQQEYRQAQEDWVRAKLRKESGASIPPDEMEHEIETYFPQPGETNVGIIEAKRQSRAQAVEQFKTMAGVVKPTIAPTPTPAPPAAAAGGAPVIATNPTTGEKIQLVGGKWVPVK